MGDTGEFLLQNLRILRREKKFLAISRRKTKLRRKIVNSASQNLEFRVAKSEFPRQTLKKLGNQKRMATPLSLFNFFLSRSPRDRHRHDKARPQGGSH